MTERDSAFPPDQLLVGESGPEIFIPQRPGRIIAPAADLADGRDTDFDILGFDDIEGQDQ